MAGWVGDPAVLMLTEAAHEASSSASRRRWSRPWPATASWPRWRTGARSTSGAVARIAGIIHLAEHGAANGSAEPGQRPDDHGRPGGSATTSRPPRSTRSPRWAPTRSPLTRCICWSASGISAADEVSERDLHVGQQPPTVHDEGGAEARAGSARRSRLPEPRCLSPNRGSWPSSITALPS